MSITTDKNINGEERKVVKNYTDLHVYQLAFSSAMIIYKISKAWPAEEKYSLTDQIRKSSRSVCGNIAEAWRKRRYPAHFVSKMCDADTEAAETEVWLDFAHSCEYLVGKDYVELKDSYDHICRMLSKMMKEVNTWCKDRKM